VARAGMNWLVDFITNPYVIIGMSSWGIAQVLKMIIYAIVNKEWSIHRLFGDGGMPSGHSATVTSLATAMGLFCGFGSAEFAIAGILAVIVCHGAMGVRLETGKQAIVLNELVKYVEDLVNGDQLPEVKLKEFVGHTPIQVIAGILIGMINCVVMYFLLF
jgi:acid phosphatase family membrane protein YuiD